MTTGQTTARASNTLLAKLNLQPRIVTTQEVSAMQHLAAFRPPHRYERPFLPDIVDFVRRGTGLEQQLVAPEAGVPLADFLLVGYAKPIGWVSRTPDYATKIRPITGIAAWQLGESLAEPPMYLWGYDVSAIGGNAIVSAVIKSPSKRLDDSDPSGDAKKLEGIVAGFLQECRNPTGEKFKAYMAGQETDVSWAVVSTVTAGTMRRPVDILRSPLVVHAEFKDFRGIQQDHYYLDISAHEGYTGVEITEKTHKQVPGILKAEAPDMLNRRFTNTVVTAVQELPFYLRLIGEPVKKLPFNGSLGLPDLYQIPTSSVLFCREK